MTILTVIIVGGIVGWLASKLMGRDEGIFASIIIGVIGSFIGSLISSLFTGSDQSYLAFSWMGFIWSLIGAVILVAIMNALSSNRSHHGV
jgi:uncharacterized membrane protein YeaQ/YmgE (transglycosylase-associated protein family)